MFRLCFLFLACVPAFFPRPAAALGTRTERPPSLREALAGYGISDLRIEHAFVIASNPTTRLRFEMGSRKLYVNDVLVLMNAPLAKQNRHIYLSMSDIDFTLHPLLAPQTLLFTTPTPMVVLDPGHGGRDGGAPGRKSADEKVLVLDIAKRVRHQLQQRGIPARLTRTGDQTVPLGARPLRAAQWKAELFVSIHLNASDNPHAAGVETFILPSAGFPSTAGGNGSMDYTPGNQHDAFNMALAYAIHRHVLSNTAAADRGIRRARFLVLRDAPCPAVLLECGFLSNTAEAARLSTPAYRQALAEGIAAGIARLRKPGR